MISVVIPTFNRAARVMDAVRSVREQTFGDWELIVVDDGSTDGTRDLVDSIDDSRVRCLRIPHGGVSRARNVGIRASQFPWISFLDSDDLWASTKLARQLESLEREPSARVVYTNEVWIRNGRHHNPKRKHRKFGGWVFRPSLVLCLISPSSVMMHRSVLERIGLFDESFRVCEDYELWIRLSARFPVVYVDRPLITKFGGHADQLSRSDWGFDRYRVRALMKCLGAGQLTAQQRIWVAAEVVRKSRILAAGFQNRKKPEMSERYRRLSVQWQGSSSWANWMSGMRTDFRVRASYRSDCSKRNA